MKLGEGPPSDAQQAVDSVLARSEIPLEKALLQVTAYPAKALKGNLPSSGCIINSHKLAKDHTLTLADSTGVVVLSVLRNTKGEAGIDPDAFLPEFPVPGAFDHLFRQIDPDRFEAITGQAPPLSLRAAA